MPRAISKNISSEKLDALAVNNWETSDSPQDAITNGEFAALLVPYANILAVQKTFAIAVSGGADSMALCLLAARWAAANDRKIIALTVDHGLRPEAKTEAETVAKWLAASDINHHILTWQGEKPSAGIQAAARNARYRLMAKWVRDNNAACLMTAHHLEDQAETFLLRTERGSGLDGLACMAPIVQRESISLLRPLLAVSKHRLRATLIEAEQNWIEDPSNQNPAYRRTKMRGVVAALKKSKLSPKLLETVVGHFAELRQHLSRVVAVFFDRAVDIFPEGYGRVQLDIFEQLPDPVLERVLVRLTSIFGGKAYPPRRDRLLRAMEKIRDQKENGFTLGGCRFFKKSNAIMICRDRRHILAQQISAGEKINWNNLFDIEIDGQGGTGAILAPLGRAGWQEIVQYKPELKAISVPYAIRLTLPALFDETGVAQVPHLNYRRDDRKNPTVTISKVRFNPRQSA